MNIYALSYPVGYLSFLAEEPNLRYIYNFFQSFEI